MSDQKIWNSLEVVKLLVSVLTPVLLLWLGMLISNSTQRTEQAIRESDRIRAQEIRESDQVRAQAIRKAEQVRTLAIRESERVRDTRRINQLAVQNLSKRIYERRSRAELLASSLKRNISLEETITRKKKYDEAYFQWNKEHQANLLLVRSVLGEQQYSDFESLIEFLLVGKIFRPLDRCLTNAYDHRVKTGKSGNNILSNCNASTLLQQALDCGYALTDELFKLTDKSGQVQRKESSSIVLQRCPS